MDITLAALNNSRICHIYNVYSGINRGVNKKEGAILRYFNVYNILVFTARLSARLVAEPYIIYITPINIRGYLRPSLQPSRGHL